MLESMLTGRLLFAEWGEIGAMALVFGAVALLHFALRRQFLEISEQQSNPHLVDSAPEAPRLRLLRQLWSCGDEFRPTIGRAGRVRIADRTGLLRGDILRRYFQPASRRLGRSARSAPARESRRVQSGIYRPVRLSWPRSVSRLRYPCSARSSRTRWTESPQDLARSVAADLEDVGDIDQEAAP